MRTVKYRALPLNTGKKTALKALCEAYAHEKGYWLDLLRSWDYQALLTSHRKIRDEFVKRKYHSRYGLQARQWKLALQDAVETWDKYWQSLFVKARTKISRHKMPDSERHYAYWLLKGYFQFAEMMKGNAPQPPFEIDTKARLQLAGYMQRTLKGLKGKPPSVKKSRIAKFDANCYDVFENEGCQYLKLMSLKRGNRIIVPLSGKGKIEGSITVVISDNSLEIHVSHPLKPKVKKEGIIEAVDFGYTEVMTDTQGIRYGRQFGQILTKTADALHEKMQKRHHIHDLEKKSRKSRSGKARRMRKFNLGRQKLSRKKKASTATLEKEINTAINELLKTKNISLLITEDLSHLFIYDKSRAINRKLSAWLRGTIQERISFKALAEGFRHEQVNPAYGSQSCPCCEFVDSRNRTGDNFKCLYCRA